MVSDFTGAPLSEVIPGKLFLGSEDNARDLELLNSCRITHVLSVVSGKFELHLPLVLLECYHV